MSAERIKLPPWFIEPRHYRCPTPIRRRRARFAGGVLAADRAELRERSMRPYPPPKVPLSLREVPV